MSEALDRIDTSYRNLMEAIEGIPEERLSERNAIGEWSVKDVLAHTAYWNEQALEETEQKLRGETVQDDGNGNDWQVINERVYTERVGWTLDQALGSLRQVHDRFVAITTDHPELSPKDIDTDVYEHVDEHTAEIRAWRRQAGL